MIAEDRKKKLHKVKRKGVSVRQLSERRGISTNTVIRYTSEPREDYLLRAEARKQASIDLRREGLTIREIAEELGLSVGSVHRYIKQAREEGTL